MVSEAPPPFTPPDCDLNGMEFMPLEVTRVMQSTLFGLSTGDEFKAAFALWCASWYEKPAASLPNDERMLAFLSKSKNWKRVREVALRGWTLCSDGRWYHETVAKVALTAWDRRVDHREENQSKYERQKRWRERCKHLAQQLRDLGVTPPRGASLETLETLLVDAESSTKASTVDGVEIGKTGRGRGEGEDSLLHAGQVVVLAARPSDEQLPDLLGDRPPEDLKPVPPPPCPHLEVLELWKQQLPQLPQHNPKFWTGARAAHLQARWREMAVSEGWKTKQDGLEYMRALFGWIAVSPFLTGKGGGQGDRMPFVIELEWLVKPANWAKVLEGKYHQTKE